MAFEFNYLSPVAVGQVAEQGGRRNSRRENVIRSLEAQQRQAMQAASIQAAYNQQANQLLDRERDRFFDMHRLQYTTDAETSVRKAQLDQQQQQFTTGEANAMARLNRGGELAIEDDRRTGEMQEAGAVREMADRRLLNRQEWEAKELSEGNLYFPPPIEARRQGLLNDYAAVDAARHLSPAEKAAQKSRIVTEYEAIQPVPVPLDKRPVKPHDALNSKAVRLTPNGFEPISGKPLTRGEAYWMPLPDGKWEKGIFEEEQFKADQEAAKESATAKNPLHESRGDFHARRAGAVKAIMLQRNNPNSDVAPTPPSQSDIDEYLAAEDAAYERRYGAKPKTGGADPFAAQPQAAPPAPSQQQAPQQHPDRKPNIGGNPRVPPAQVYGDRVLVPMGHPLYEYAGNFDRGGSGTERSIPLEAWYGQGGNAAGGWSPPQGGGASGQDSLTSKPVAGPSDPLGPQSQEQQQPPTEFIPGQTAPVANQTYVITARDGKRYRAQWDGTKMNAIEEIQ